MLKDCCDLLEQHQLKVAFLESASSGYLCSQFSIYKNSGAEIFLGGLVCYDPQVKLDVLHINPALIERYTAESAEVTRALCEQADRLFPQADLWIGCTGLLKPGGSESPDKPVGTFFVCIRFHEAYHEYRYQLGRDPLTSLDLLTDSIASEIIQLIQAQESTY